MSDDLISRDAAIEALKRTRSQLEAGPEREWEAGKISGMSEAINYLEAFGAAEPPTDGDLISRDALDVALNGLICVNCRRVTCLCAAGPMVPLLSVCHILAAAEPSSPSSKISWEM